MRAVAENDLRDAWNRHHETHGGKREDFFGFFVVSCGQTVVRKRHPQRTPAGCSRGNRPESASGAGANPWRGPIPTAATVLLLSLMP